MPEKLISSLFAMNTFSIPFFSARLRIYEILKTNKNTIIERKILVSFLYT